MKKVLLGAMLMLLLLLSSAAAVMRLGLLPVSADGNHPSLEGRIMPALLHAGVARRASSETNPIAINEENLKAGIRTYKTMCATCHGTAKEGAADRGIC